MVGFIPPKGAGFYPKRGGSVAQKGRGFIPTFVAWGLSPTKGGVQYPQNGPPSPRGEVLSPKGGRVSPLLLGGPRRGVESSQNGASSPPLKKGGVLFPKRGILSFQKGRFHPPKSEGFCPRFCWGGCIPSKRRV